MSQDDRAAVVICLGINPYSPEKTMQGLVVCSGILDYFRAIQGRGYIMTINFSGTRLLQAKTPEQAAACLREDCADWAGVLDKAVQRLRRDAPACRHVEVVLVGTDEVPSHVRDSAELCRRFKGNGIRINSILIEPTGDDENGGGGPNGGSGRGFSNTGGGWTILDGSPTSSVRASSLYDAEPDVWGMVRLARETGGLSLLPNTEGKLAMHQLFSEMFRRWGEGYWKSTTAGQKSR